MSRVPLASFFVTRVGDRVGVGVFCCVYLRWVIFQFPVSLSFREFHSRCEMIEGSHCRGGGGGWDGKDMR